MASPQIFVVIGMHRSGTSLTMQALGQLGLASGDGLLPGNAYNQRGYWEAAEVVALHDQLLSDFDRPWGAFQHLLPLPDDWLTSAPAARARSRIIEILQIRLSKQGIEKAIAIKDPRMSLFLPLWYEAAATLGVTLRTIICLRNSWDVAQSLLRRDAIPLDAGRLLWLLYTATALRDAKPDSTVLSYFGDWTSAPEAALARLARFTDSAVLEELHVYESGLVTQTPQIGDAVVQRWHGLLQQCRASGQITETLQREALTHLQNAQHFKIWPDVLSDGQAQKKISTVFVRELWHLKQDRDAQALRAQELLLAYETEATRSVALQSGLDAVSSERDAQALRAQELLLAYETEAARSVALAGRLARLNPKTWFRRSSGQ